MALTTMTTGLRSRTTTMPWWIMLVVTCWTLSVLSLIGSFADQATAYTGAESRTAHPLRRKQHYRALYEWQAPSEGRHSSYNWNYANIKLRS